MTTAVCLQCGTFKFGAFTPCTSCGFLPATPEDQAKAIALSDHNLDSRSLKDISKRLAAGEKLQFNEQPTTETEEEEETPPSYLLGVSPMFVVGQLAKAFAKALMVVVPVVAILYFILWKLFW